MRGTIIMWSGDKGVVAIPTGERYEFGIDHWRGDSAPKPDMSVHLTLMEGTLTAVNPILEIDLAKERIGKLGEEGVKVARGVLDNVGKDVAVSYGVFAVFALFFNMLSGKGMFASLAITLPGLLNGVEGMIRQGAGFSSGGTGLLLVLLAIASVSVPYFWKHKYAPLAFFFPLVVTLYADLQLYRAYSAVKEQFAELNQLGSTLGSMFGSNTFSGKSTPQISVDIPVELGIGAYVCLAAAAYIAFRGFRRYRQVSLSQY
jgi:hypothetical protein